MDAFQLENQTLETPQIEPQEQYRQGICEDCGRHNHLIETPACADYQCMGNLCCSKWVCQDHCVYQCPNGHENHVDNYDGWIGNWKCETCQIQWKPAFQWWGMSIAEYNQRYGY